MALPVNPYVAGNPVGDSPAFVGRADVLREVLRVLRRPQDNAIVLFGQRRIGKTSILEHLAATLPDEGPYRTVYFDLQDKADWPLPHVLKDLARTIAHAQDQPDPDLDDDPEVAFRDEWLPAMLDDLPQSCSLVLLFDEFDVLADPQKEQAAAAFFPYLRNLLASDPERLQFVFVIGRNVDDLTTIALSLFKGTTHRRISLLSREDTDDLVRLSEANDTLHWPDGAVERVWQLTNGHPFLTQQLCSHVWEQMYDEEPDESPTVLSADVDEAVPDALDTSRNTLEWLWDGLGPAERVVASALAEAGPSSITETELENLLQESGVRVIIRELQHAPQLLQEWDILEPTDGGYRFRVELLRHWIAEHKPLSRVQEELDRIEPLAERLYQAAIGFYQGGQLDQAVDLLRQALGINPNHVRANQLLADILLAQGEPGEARQLLARFYQYQPAAARHRLVQALLALAQAAENDESLALYERVLELAPSQPEANAGRRRIWQQRGDAAVERDDLEAAVQAYRASGLADKAAEVEQEMRRRGLTARLQKLEALEQEGWYQDALSLVHELANEYAERDWTPDRQRLERKTHLEDMYQRALQVLDSGDRQTTQARLAEVIALEPGYKYASRYLHQAVTGIDVAELQGQLEEERAARQKAETSARKEMGTRRQQEQELGRLQAALQSEQKARRRAENSLGEGSNPRLPGWLAWGGVGMLVLIAFGLGFLGGAQIWPAFQPTPTRTPAPTTQVTVTSTPTGMPTPTPPYTPTSALHVTRTRSIDGMVMVYVPTGEFEMGSLDGDSDEQPVHIVTLDGFEIDQTEVTNAQYALCVADGECAESAYADDSDYNGNDYPVVGVSWNDAVDYCAWAGAQLPTEAQWEYAARGPDNRIYPWGNDFDCSRGNFDDETEMDDYVVPGGAGCDGYVRTAPVGIFPDGASWCGARDLAGNVWEWTADWYGDYAPEAQTNPAGPVEGDYKVLRGGSFYVGTPFFRTSNRSVSPVDARLSLVGFRCVSAAPGQ